MLYCLSNAHFIPGTRYELIVQLRFTDLVRNEKWRIVLNTVGEKKKKKKPLKTYTVNMK